MFPNYGAPNFSPTDPPASHAPQLKLAAHTDKANALAERLFRRTISQNDYNSQIYSTCIASTHNDKSIPIIMTLDDNIIAIKGFAKRGFNMPATPLLASRLYVVLSTKKIPRTSSDQPVPENAILLHKETLETVMTFMKSSPYVEQFLMDFAKAPPTGSAGSMPSDQTDYRFSPPFDELPIDQKGKKRGSSTDLESEAFDPMAAFTQKSDRIFEEYLRGSDYTKRANTKLEEDLTKKERRSGS